MNATDFAARAEALLDAPEPTTWLPRDAEKAHPALLVGELVALENSHTARGPCQIAIVKDAEGGLWNVWLIHAVLKSEFAAQKPRYGEMIAIRWEGRVQGGQGENGYEKYRLVVDRQPGATPEYTAVDDVVEATPSAEPAVVPEAAEPVREPEAPEPTPVPAAEATCSVCKFVGGHHLPGCPEDIPF